MNHKLTGITGVLITIIFIVGLLVLFIFNPKTYDEVNTLSMTVYNLPGMNGRMWAVIVVYLTVGLLNILFGAGLLFSVPKNALLIVGKSMVIASGILWMSFGLFAYDFQSTLHHFWSLNRIILIIVFGSSGLIILGAEFEKISGDKFLKWYTLSSGLLIMLLSFMSAFVFDDNTWIRINLSFTIYFVWFGVFGLRVVLQKI